MKRNNIFWGAMLILLGTLFMLDNLGYFPGFDVWPIFLALFLMALGVWILVEALWHPKTSEEHVTLPLEGASLARLHLKHGAGRLELAGADVGANLFEGDFTEGLSLRARHEGNVLDADLSTPAQHLSLGTRRNGYDWRMKVNRTVRYELVELQSGASEAELDLGQLNVEEIKVQTGASSTRVTVPALGQTRLNADTGAATLRVVIPQGVAARIHAKGGLYTLSVDTLRFPKVGDVYVSPDFDGAVNRLEMEVTAGVGTVQVE